MDPTGLDISEQSNRAVTFELSVALASLYQRYALLCRLYALSYCTSVAPPHAYEPAPAPPPDAAAASGHTDAASTALWPRRAASASLGAGFHGSARSCRSSPALAGFAAGRSIGSDTATEEPQAG